MYSNRDIHYGSRTHDWSVVVRMVVNGPTYCTLRPALHNLHPTIYTPQLAPRTNLPIGPPYLSGVFAFEEIFSKENIWKALFRVFRILKYIKSNYWSARYNSWNHRNDPTIQDNVENRKLRWSFKPECNRLRSSIVSGRCTRLCWSWERLSRARTMLQGKGMLRPTFNKQLARLTCISSLFTALQYVRSPVLDYSSRDTEIQKQKPPNS